MGTSSMSNSISTTGQQYVHSGIVELTALSGGGLSKKEQVQAILPDQKWICWPCRRMKREGHDDYFFRPRS